MYEFVVLGVPVPQGSKNARVYGKRAILYDVKSKELRAWRGKVRAEGMDWMNRNSIAPVSLDAVSMRILFQFPEPSSYRTKGGHPSSKYRRHYNKKPDVDKLTRAILDALTGVFYKDDSRVVEIDSKKVFGDFPCAIIQIKEM